MSHEFPTPDCLTRAANIHEETYGTPGTISGHAPGVWVTIGEHIDTFGGLALLHHVEQRVAVVASPREDSTVAVTASFAASLSDSSTQGTTVSESATFKEATHAIQEQSPHADEHGQPIEPPMPKGGLALRLTAVALNLMQRGVLSRESTGFNITVVSELPQGSGFYELAAMDAAFAVAAASRLNDRNEPPIRLKLAEACISAADSIAAFPAVCSVYHVLLRSQGTGMSVMNHADGALTQTPSMVGRNFSLVAARSPEGGLLDVPEEEAAEQQRIRQRFVSKASHAFGVDYVNLLPDATARVIQWLEANHQVLGPEGWPSTHEAAAWLRFWGGESERASTLLSAIRALDFPTASRLINASTEALNTDYGIAGTAIPLGQLLLKQGADSARPAAPGRSRTVAAVVPNENVTEVLEYLAGAGIEATKVATLSTLWRATEA
ncbi:Galactokinase [Corynebacterium renale]|uniref:galactokinase family protein n=1 Tax=Corynebacterium renale TaxID=1724 RepID=UPI000DA2C85A|nr:galactokinase family protein [Corynebacterium renale]SQG65067.1 Galactokinase [Corynebacterium renale]STC97324.1 Galactokinase [Corynebacterium renale]